VFNHGLLELTIALSLVKYLYPIGVNIVQLLKKNHKYNNCVLETKC